MPPKKTVSQVAAPMPLFRKLPAEIQLMIFHEALRKPQIHFVKATREQNPGERNPSWTVALKPRDKSSDTSGYRLFNNFENIARSFPVAAEVMRKNILEPQRLPLLPVLKEGSWSIDAATDLVVIEFDHDKSGRMRFWHTRNRVYTSTQDVDAIRRQLEGIRKVAFVYGDGHQPDAGSSESVFPCLNHHQRKHASWQFCPEELLGFIYQLSHVEAVYFILNARINTKLVKEYATSYFSVPAAIRNSFGFKTFYSTTRSYVTVPLPSYTIGPVYHATWKTKDCVWPEKPLPVLIKIARASAATLPPDSKEKQYAEHTRKLSHLSRKLNHRDKVSPLVSEMIRQMRADQNTPVSPDYEWPDPPPPLVNTTRFKAHKEQHRRDYNLDNFTRERRDNLEFGMLLMVDDVAPPVSKKGEKKEKIVKSKAGAANKKKTEGDSVPAVSKSDEKNKGVKSKAGGANKKK